MRTVILAALAAAMLFCAPASAQTEYDNALLALAQYLASVEGGCATSGIDKVCVIPGEQQSILREEIRITHYTRSADAESKVYAVYSCDLTASYVIGRLADEPTVTLDCGSPEATHAVEHDMALRPKYLEGIVVRGMTWFFRFIPTGRSQFA